jgi:hypothetical protein
MLGNQPLEAGILLLQHFESPRVAALQATMSLLPPVEGLLAAAVLASQSTQRRADFVLFQDTDDLLL